MHFSKCQPQRWVRHHVLILHHCETSAAKLHIFIRWIPLRTSLRHKLQHDTGLKLKVIQVTKLWTAKLQHYPNTLHKQLPITCFPAQLPSFPVQRVPRPGRIQRDDPPVPPPGRRTERRARGPWAETWNRELLLVIQTKEFHVNYLILILNLLNTN